MKTMLVVACMGTVGAWAALGEDEQKIPLDQVPAKVKAAVVAKFPNGKMESAEKEIEKGKTSYEIALSLEGSKVEVIVSEEGVIQEVERQIEPTAIPKSVMAALKAKHPDPAIKKAEEVTKGGETFFEVVVSSAGGKDVEVKLGAEWKIVSEETVEAKKEGKN